MPGMRRRLLSLCLTGLIAAALPVAPAPAQSSFKLAAALTPAEYQEKLAQYLHARRAYEQEAERYWNTVTQKRIARRAKHRKHERFALSDYVLTQPPVYRGPPRPVNPAGPGPVPGEKHRPYIPVVADFVKAAAKEFGFVPQQVSEIAFKRAYAKAAREAGLTRDQIVGIYAFETDGHGTYDEQPGITPRRPHGPAISPALGYNQLLSTNTLSLIADHGNHMLAALRQKAKTLSGAQRSIMERKIEAFKRMLAFSRSIPPRWSKYDVVAKTTPRGWGVHAAVLDRDLGPMLQVQNLVDSLRFARANGYTGSLTAAELELMNLTGDGNGLDMVMMPQAWRARVPTANFFQQRGYERNPVARRAGVVTGLLKEINDTIDHRSRASGAKDMAAAF
jgi:hypothetical protein